MEGPPLPCARKEEGIASRGENRATRDCRTCPDSSSWGWPPGSAWEYRDVMPPAAPSLYLCFGLMCPQQPERVSHLSPFPVCHSQAKSFQLCSQTTLPAPRTASGTYHSASRHPPAFLGKSTSFHKQPSRPLRGGPFLSRHTTPRHTHNAHTAPCSAAHAGCTRPC